MKKHILLLILLLSCSFCGFSQDEKMEKAIKKANTLIEKNKREDAAAMLVKALDESPSHAEGWDLLSKIRYEQWNLAKQNDNLFGGKITVTTTGKDGKQTTGGDSLANALMTLLQNVKPSSIAYDKFITTVRTATLRSNQTYNSSMYLRLFEVDPDLDTAVSKKALKLFKEAETEFAAQNYEKAAKLYRNAFEEQPDYYKARLYLGDTYFAMGNYIKSIEAFKEAIAKYPYVVEPRKYLVDAYLNESLFDKALEESISSMAVYPDLSMTLRLNASARKLNKKLDIKWTERPIFPNKIGKESADEKVNVKNPWDLYYGAKGKISTYCDDKGLIIKTNSLTKAKYLEVYSWEEMLKNSDDPKLNEAKRMQKEGYLDCYVMVSCFHFDFYDQYLDFISKNRDRIIDYHKKFLVEAN